MFIASVAVALAWPRNSMSNTYIALLLSSHMRVEFLVCGGFVCVGGLCGMLVHVCMCGGEMCVWECERHVCCVVCVVCKGDKFAVIACFAIKLVAVPGHSPQLHAGGKHFVVQQADLTKEARMTSDWELPRWLESERDEDEYFWG